ncbi:MAG: superoxide dismutase [Bacteroidales bacterium]|nr:superoxide dismutase [Bacteroidales bacterium]
MKSRLLTLIMAFFITNIAIGQFVQEPLPYAYDELEPYIDAQTMEIHYTKHHKGYVDKLNNALQMAGIEHNGNILDLLENISQYEDGVRNNAGGHYNHTLFWSILSPEPNINLSENLLKSIDENFNSMEELKKQFIKEASSLFGSGWTWLIVTPDKKLAIVSTKNQDNPLMDDAPVKGTPVLGIDIWEHAYYLKYQNRRGEYLNSLWEIINWDAVETMYNEALAK